MYKIGTLAKKTGFSPTLLRAWERRHGLLRPVRGPGGQRLYGEEDLRLLEVIKQELARGRSIGELAASGGELLGAGPRSVTAMQGARAALVDSDGQESTPEYFVEAMLAAAASLDGASLRAVRDSLFASLSADVAVYRVFIPVLHRMGEGWSAGQISVAAEHLASGLMESRVLGLVETIRQTRQSLVANSKKALCCCFPEEEHRIGMATVAYCLSRHGWDAVFLGSSLPFADLEDAVVRLKPSTVWLSVTSAVLYARHRADLFSLAARHEHIRFVVGGQAVRGEDRAMAGDNCLFAIEPCSLPGCVARLVARL